ncbi:MAG: CYTH domain-containing protein [Porphyromonas sp.]|nr:CYTH domain-containing protein [Porphyromonas sp.]
MGVEIERKFLLKPGVSLPDSDHVLHIRQFYLNSDETLSVRVRLVDEAKAYVTIKKVTGDQLTVRSEFEYEIPVEDAREMEAFAVGATIVKNRHIIMIDDVRWEVDFFSEANEGLMLTEVELESLDTPVQLPPWVGREVSDDPRYLNNQLAAHPYTSWKDEE